MKRVLSGVHLSPQVYRKLADAHAPASPILRNVAMAYLIGGGICTAAQGLTTLYGQALSLSREDAGTLTSATLILTAVILTALGWFDRIAKVAGAGTLVPITGFANAVVSPAIDSRAEGMILGVGAKMFTVAGPVIVYGVVAGAVYGVIYWVAQLL